MKHLQIFKFFENKNDYYKEISVDEYDVKGVLGIDWEEKEVKQICVELINIINDIYKDGNVEISEMTFDIKDIWEKGEIYKYLVMSQGRSLVAVKKGMNPIFRTDLLGYFSNCSIREIALKFVLSKFSDEMNVKKRVENIKIIKLEDEWFLVNHSGRVEFGKITPSYYFNTKPGFHYRKLYECDQVEGLIEFLREVLRFDFIRQ